ncbi:glycosyltransferase [uncultured Algibacter sp.]|jgi:glycosyltransferase involved in cell wall biosynthesis|uniref:glycosyltransferase family 2 protein n=1 Tax=uncultured Algibacter sp. TaxID=298659 RepID=UPI0025ED6CF2|nr:glycosyltransferase [uncultured Algibacter sp.]
MLSILIPTYNYNVYPFACQIEKQAIKSKIDFEIICFDDGSNSIINLENKKINSLINSQFIARKNNIGLSNIRNALAEASKYSNLLFIDGDSLLPNEQFIIRYKKALKENTDIVYGGRIHPKKVDANRKLRWKYGIFREDSTANQRNKNIYKNVLFNNTLIKKKLFNSIGFEKSISKYGHEDTVFAYKLSKTKASILHIDNPVLHGDVDLNQVYYQKTHQSLKNLDSIYKTKMIEPEFTTFLKVFMKLEKFKLNYLFALFYKILSPFFTFNLTSKYPSLYVFELFRLSYFCNINLKK